MGHQLLVGFGGPYIANTCSVAAVSPRRRVPLVRPGRRPPGEDRPGGESVQRRGRVAHDGKLLALNIRRALDASLTRLQTGYIDLCQFHHVDRATPWDEIWQAIDVAVTAGKILFVGSSNFAGCHIAGAQEAARDSGAGRTLRAVSATRSGPHAPDSGRCRWSARTPPRPGRLTGPQQGQGLGFSDVGCWARSNYEPWSTLREHRLTSEEFSWLPSPHCWI
jgi:hypothetical protein